MKVRFMQLVDFYIGVPLCFLCSIFNSFFKLFRPRAWKQPKRILFIELSEMGSAVLAYSALKRAAELFEDAELYFLIFAKNKESVSLLGVFEEDHILVVDERSFFSFIFSLLARIRDMRKFGIDTVVDLELFSRCTALISFFSGARHRAGFDNATEEGLYRGKLLTHPVLYNTQQHISLNFLSLVYALTEENYEPPLLKQNLADQLIPLPHYSLAPKKQEEMMLLLKRLHPEFASQSTRLILLNPDPGLLPLRAWPVENFRELSGQLLQADKQALVAVIGLPRAESFAQVIASGPWRHRVLDLTGFTETMEDLLCLFSLSWLLISNDSGPAHFACLTDIYSLILFGPETPRRYAPLGEKSLSISADLSCSPCYSAANHRFSRCTNNLCLQAISVAQVFGIVSQLLARTEKAEDAH